MNRYDHKPIEKKWQAVWEKEKLHEVIDDPARKKTYLLIEFPYPSGEGLHVGHIRSYTALDILARKRRRQGENVLYPIGWDAFGLPTENFAIKTGRDPREVTQENTNTYRRQLKSLGLSFDWSREINTSDPAYYRWTQWIFLQFFKQGLAYKARMPINWCPQDKIGLANEEVADGRCERCGALVERRDKEQWLLTITKYAERLEHDLDLVDFREDIKIQQRNWIGKSEGALISFQLLASSVLALKKIDIFTTRPDTIFAATFIALAPELAQKWLELGWPAREEVKQYLAKTWRERSAANRGEVKEKTGIDTGLKTINPANNEEIPVWVVNYVAGDYGTGAIMAVPAHDERDFEFAKKYHLPISDASLVSFEEALKKSGGQKKVQYKLRDWIFSRQRYWGEPIPMIYCEKCDWQAVPEKDLPVLLPKVEKYQPTTTGESPLAAIQDWVNTTCPHCGGPARRETDVMPNWAGSSWYYLAYCVSENLKSEALISKQFSSAEIQNKFKYWLPVDWYNGGMEHVTLHLLYSRFWHKFLFDLGLVPTAEPYQKRTAHGLILAEAGGKMSKSKGNVISPDDIVERFGADSLRVYEMFIGPFDQAIAWSTDGLIGVRRFLERVIRLSGKVSEAVPEPELERLMHLSIQKISADIEALKLNTAVSQLMIFANKLQEASPVPRSAWTTFLSLLAPFTPHLADELWQRLGNKNSIHRAPWPEYDPRRLETETVTIVVQVNGVVRNTITVSKNTPEEKIVELALADKKIIKWLNSKTLEKHIYVKGKLLNFVA